MKRCSILIVATLALLIAGCSSQTSESNSSIKTPKCAAAPTTFVTGETFHAHGCYTIPPNGVKVIANDVTIKGISTWNDANTRSCPFTKCSPEDIHGRPSITITGTDDTLDGVTVVGVNPWLKDHTYHPGLAAGAGIALSGSDNTTLINDNVHSVFGDCLSIGPNHFPQPGWTTTRNLTVAKFTGRDCGLQGISPVAVNIAHFTDITLGATSQATWDFEDDSLGEAAKNITVDSCSDRGGVNIASSSNEGPITFTNCVLGHNVALSVSSSGKAPFVNFIHDSLNCGDEAYLACVNVKDGTVNITDSTIHVGGKHEKLYTAINGSSIEFYGVMVTGTWAAGTHDASSVFTGNTNS